MGNSLNQGLMQIGGRVMHLHVCIIYFQNKNWFFSVFSGNNCNLGTAISNYCLKIIGGYIETNFKFRRSSRECQTNDTIFSEHEKKTNEENRTGKLSELKFSPMNQRISGLFVCFVVFNLKWNLLKPKNQESTGVCSQRIFFSNLIYFRESCIEYNYIRIHICFTSQDLLIHVGYSFAS